MDNALRKQLIIVEQASLDPHRVAENASLFNPDGSSFSFPEGSSDAGWVKLKIVATRNPADIIIFGKTGADTISVKGVDNTEDTIPSWFEFDDTPDTDFGYGIALTEEGLYTGIIHLSGQYEQAAVAQVFLELIEKDTGYEIDWGGQTGYPGPQGALLSLPVSIKVMETIPNGIRASQTNVMKLGELAGFTLLYSTPVPKDPAGTTTACTLDLMLSKVA